MIKLLISVKNVDEALIALQSGVDIIDLKDPEVGALGALDLDLSQQILQKIEQFKALTLNQAQPFTSATVGENHINADDLIKEIDARIEAGVDIVKIATSDLCRNNALKKLIGRAQRAKLIAIFFAEQTIEFTLLEQLKDIGFYGAMIDTQKKQQNLFEICGAHVLQNFVEKCQDVGLKTGLAGSLKPQHIEKLADINPSYIGFRGGVCADNLRNNNLMIEKITNLKKMLQEHNKLKDLARSEPSLALHS